MSSLDLARDDPEALEGSKDALLLVVRHAHHERECTDVSHPGD